MNAQIYDKDFGEKIQYLKERTQTLKQRIDDDFAKRLDAYTDFAMEAENQINEKDDLLQLNYKFDKYRENSQVESLAQTKEMVNLDDFQKLQLEELPEDIEDEVEQMMREQNELQRQHIKHISKQEKNLITGVSQPENKSYEPQKQTFQEPIYKKSLEPLKK